MTTRRSPGIALSQLQEALQTLPVSRAAGEMDRRSLARSRGIVANLGDFRPSEVASALQISTQKFVALRKAVAEGRISSPVLNDLLDQARSVVSEVPKLKREEFTAEIPHKGKRVLKTDQWEVPYGWMRKNVPWAKDIKPAGFASKRSAMNWLGNVGGAAQYFVIVRRKLKTGQTRWHVYDIRSPKEHARKGKLRTAPTATRRMQKAATHGNKTRSRRKSR